jgi:hypothetical protein
MRILVLYFIVLSSFNFFSQTYIKNSIGISVGGRDGVKFPGSVTRITQIHSYSLNFRRMHSYLFGSSLEASYDYFKFINGNSPSHYARLGVNLHFNITDILKFNDFSKRLGMHAFTGFGYARLWNNGGMAPVPPTTMWLQQNPNMDQMLYGSIGLSGVCRINTFMSLNLTVSNVFNLRQRRQFDGQSLIPQQNGFTSGFYKLSLGVNFYFGKGNAKEMTTHADWFNRDKDLKDSFYFANDHIKQRVLSLERKLQELKSDKNNLGEDLSNQPNNGNISGIYSDFVDLDFDRDGLSNKNDLCPFLSGTAFGCPDSDGDGVPDFMDACIDEVGSLLNNGCPSLLDSLLSSNLNLDWDGDGVLNVDDICPLIKGTAFGCPDNDGDGVPNFCDACPDERGLQRYMGCVDSLKNYGNHSNAGTQSGKLPFDPSILENYGVYDVLFDVGSSQLLWSGKRILDNLVRLMKDYPDVRIIVSGHADKTGNPELNKVLSKKRTEVCLNYIIAAGISKERFKIQHFGSELPKYNDNSTTTLSGNRRVSFQVE